MKERPILFSAPMVNAILQGRKTQTRRVVKYRITGPNKPDTLDFYNGDRWRGACHMGGRSGNALGLCPYGVPGDRLWVRETWMVNPIREFGPPLDSSHCCYRADNTTNGAPAFRWTPSIHMPRWASRITLEVTGVRVERLQEISEEDAKAEGVTDFHNITDQRTGEVDRDAVDAYEELWESINGPDSWAANPWVWVVEFPRFQ